MSRDPHKIDVYALGVTFHILLTPQFDPLEADSVETASLPLSIPFTRDIRDLIRNMVHPDPNLRFNIQQVASHPWFGKEGAEKRAMA